MIFEIQSIYLIMQFFVNLLRSRTLDMETRLNKKIASANVLENSLNGILMDKLTRRFKRAPMFPGGFPYPGPRGYPRPYYPGEYAYPPGHGYEHRPHLPTYQDYMTEHRRRANTLQKYQGIGYITNEQMFHMVSQTLYDFFAASTLGQYHGGKQLDTSTNRAIGWLQKKIRGYAIADRTTEEPRWRPPQWSPPHFN